MNSLLEQGSIDKQLGGREEGIICSLTWFSISNCIMNEGNLLFATVSEYVTPVDVSSGIAEQVVVLKEYITVGYFCRN